MEKDYFDYLSQRSLKGKLYRNFVLYPLLTRNFDQEMVVLDFGCGIGDYLQYRKNTIGVDLNSKNIRYCKELGLNATIFENGKIPLEDNGVDAVIMDNVLEHIEEPTSVLKEIKRVLKKNGSLLIGVPGEKGFKSDCDHKIFYDQENLTKLLKINNYSVIKYYYTPLNYKSDFLSKNLKIYSLYVLAKING